MNYLPKLLSKVEQCPGIFTEKDVNFILGLTATQVKELKKFALNNGLICKNEEDKTYYLTNFGQKYLSENPHLSWISKEFPKRPDTNLEYLKLEKMPPVVSRGIRLLAKHMLEGETLKENSTEEYFVKELLNPNSKFDTIYKEMKKQLLKPECSILEFFKYFSKKPYGLTKSVISILLLDIIAKNKDSLAIYEKGQFQLKLDQTIFDRMIYVSKNFIIKCTKSDTLPILAQLSKIVLPCGSTNILDITKGIIYIVRNLDKFSLLTNNLDKKIIKFRNAVINAKDPISLIYKDIPKILCGKILCQCGPELVKEFEYVIKSLQETYTGTIKNLQNFFFKCFNEKSAKNLSKRFEKIKDYLSDDELKILYNNINVSDLDNTQWFERIAAFINKVRVPKDWTDNDVAEFKLKIKELALKFLAIEAGAGSDIKLDKSVEKIIEQISKLNEFQRKGILRKLVNL